MSIAPRPVDPPVDPFEEMIACPVCDMLQLAPEIPLGGRIVCRRCHTVLMTNRAGAFDRALATALASVILMAAAVFFPFLEVSIGGLTSRASVLQVAMAFSGGIIAPLSAVVCMMIVVIPVLRAVALAYTVLPLRLGRAAAPGAERAFRMSAELKPWSMAEVFVVGAVVALVKMAGMASVSLGPAFWALTGLVVLVIYEGANFCEWSVWKALEDQRR